jgi:hypothetical protein
MTWPSPPPISLYSYNLPPSVHAPGRIDPKNVLVCALNADSVTGKKENKQGFKGVAKTCALFLRGWPRWPGPP